MHDSHGSMIYMIMEVSREMNPNTQMTDTEEDSIMRLKIQARDLKAMAKLVAVVEDSGQTISLRSYKRLSFIVENPSEGLVSELCRQGAHVTQDSKFSPD